MTCWRITANKVHRHRRVSATVAESSSISHLDAERMIGMTQQLTNMLPNLKPLTFPLLEAVQRTHSDLHTPVTPDLKDTAKIWLWIYFDLLDWRPLSHPVDRAPLTGPAIGIFPIIDSQCHHIRVYLLGQRPVCIFWSDNLQIKVFSSSATRLNFPHLFLLTLGLLCAVYVHAKTIKHSSFTCFTDSTLLVMIMQKGRDKQCRKTLALIKAIFTNLIHLGALPTFILSEKFPLPEARTIDVPTPVFNWFRHMRHSPAEAVANALISNTTISSL